MDFEQDLSTNSVIQKGFWDRVAAEPVGSNGSIWGANLGY